jgi:hypothetical protein
MALDIEDPPVQAPLLDFNGHMSRSWKGWFETNIASIQTYIGQFGIVVPSLTMDQQKELQNIPNGTIIYVTDLTPSPTFQGRVEGTWKTFTLT